MLLEGQAEVSVGGDTRQFDLPVRESPGFARHVMKIMADRLRRMNKTLTVAVRERAVRGRGPR